MTLPAKPMLPEHSHCPSKSFQILQLCYNLTGYLSKPFLITILESSTSKSQTFKICKTKSLVIHICFFFCSFKCLFGIIWLKYVTHTHIHFGNDQIWY